MPTLDAIGSNADGIGLFGSFYPSNFASKTKDANRGLIQADRIRTPKVLQKTMVPFLKQDFQKGHCAYIPPKGAGFRVDMTRSKPAPFFIFTANSKRAPAQIDYVGGNKMEQKSQASEYQKLMEQAPQIKASGLTGDYRALAEFNNVVLAGHPTKLGMEFVTWEWVQNHTALWQGHYYGDSYAAAKQDFATRSGLIPSDALFSSEQLAEVYRSIYETLENIIITPERQQRLQSAAYQIESIVPDLEERAELSLQKEEEYFETHDLEQCGYTFFEIGRASCRERVFITV